MKADNKENLVELFKKFMSCEEAQKAEEDVLEGDKIVYRYPAPEPDQMLLANIKAEIALHILPHKTKIFSHIAYKIFATAAAVVIITALSINLFEHGDSSVGSGATYSKAAIFSWSGDNTELASLTSRIEQIESDLYALEWGQTEEISSDSIIDDLEAQVAAINGSVW